MPTSSFFRDWDINANAVRYPTTTPIEGMSFVRPLLAFNRSVPTISAAIAKPNKTHAIAIE
jgi:hypothetical protein